MIWPEMVPKPLADLRILKIKVNLVALEECRLPPFLGSTLRGGLAMAFRKMVCTANISLPCDGCKVQATCPYPALLDTPQASGTQAVRRMRDIPHPVLIEPPAYHSGPYKPGDRLSFCLVLLGNAISRLPFFVFSAGEMVKTGLGATRSRFALDSVEGFIPAGDAMTGQQAPQSRCIYRPEEGVLCGDIHVDTVAEKVARMAPPEAVRMVLETPLRIQSDGKIQGKDFDLEVFLKTACRRLWAILVSHEGVAPEKIDFRPLLVQDYLPRIESMHVRWQPLSRYSNRQKAKLPLDGIRGDLILRGNLSHWWPILVAIEEVHVGKGSIMGLGKVRMIAYAQHLCHQSGFDHLGPE